MTLCCHHGGATCLASVLRGTEQFPVLLMIVLFGGEGGSGPFREVVVFLERWFPTTWSYFM